MKIESSEEAEELTFLVDNVCGNCNISHVTICKDCFITKFRLEIANYISENGDSRMFYKLSEKDIECFRNALRL